MAKLQINIPEGLVDVLSKEELKHVLGGAGSEMSFGSGTYTCNYYCESNSNCGSPCPNCVEFSNGESGPNGERSVCQKGKA